MPQIIQLSTIVAFIAALGSVGTCARAQNLVTNGSFELGPFDNSDPYPLADDMRLFPGSTNITGWTIGGANGVDWLDGSLTGGAAVGNQQDGNRSVDLQGQNPPGPLSSLSTSFATTIGATYHLSFYAAEGTSAASATVKVGSLTPQTFTGGGPNDVPPFTFARYDYDFTATALTSTLTYQVTLTGGYGPVLDNVTVIATPEPTAIAAILLPALLLTARRVRGKKVRRA